MIQSGSFSAFCECQTETPVPPSLLSNSAFSSLRFSVLSDEHIHVQGFPGGTVVKNLPSNTGDLGLIPRLRRSSGEGNGNPFQNSCLENPRDRRAWWATVYGVARAEHEHRHTS